MDNISPLKLVLISILTGIAAVFLIGFATRDRAENASMEKTVALQPYTVAAENLQIPWDIAFLPDGSMLATERPGRVVHIESGQVFPVSGVAHRGEGGLLGIALHPDFAENNFVYLYQTTSANGGLQNRVVRYVYSQNTFTFDRVILGGIPGAANHDGGRIEFGPDGMLYITTGDASNESSAQNTNILSGKILRVGDNGAIPADNTFGNAIYSYGHRNPQGLAWDESGRLWSTEHGRSGALSGYDEINLIEIGGNYGWPDNQGDSAASGTIAPVRHSGSTSTWAPASAAFHNGNLFFGGLRGAALYEAVIGENNKITQIKEHFKNEFGRIRTVRLGPDGHLYLTTSNRDGRGRPRGGDDKIIRINPDTLNSN